MHTSGHGIRSRMIRSSSVFAFALAIFLLNSALWGQAWAGDVSAAGARAVATDDVSESTGAFAETVPIEVPDFHDIEPKLGLAYNSGAGNGFVGVGWTLDGLSFIDRASIGGGTPRYDGTDIFMMDGRELISGCTMLGGTHCLRHQSYERITYDAVANSGAGSWVVVGKDGTRSTYASIYPSLPGVATFRWALKTRQDTHGNTVNYGYWCDTAQNCYIDTIAYNGVVIKFYSDTRTDGFNFARGGGVDPVYHSGTGWLGWTNYRLAAVEISVGGTRARAYKLGYAYSGTSSRSLLKSIQQFGRDASVQQANTTDATGNPVVTTTVSGSSLPPTLLGYSAESVAAPSWSTTAWLGAPIQAAPVSTYCIEGDFNGDGKTDRACEGNLSGAWYVNLSTGSGFSGAWWSNGPISSSLGQTCFSGDTNGDGKTDIICETDLVGNWRASYSTGSGWNTVNLTSGPAGADLAQSCFSGDLNGDGMTDLTCSTGSGSTTWITWLTGPGGWTQQTWPGGPAVGFPVSNQCFPGDFNGDGKADFSCEMGQSTGVWRTSLSTGSGWIEDYFSSGPNTTGPKTVYPVSNACMAGDYTGDGKTDLLCSTGQQQPTWYLAQSTGVSWIGQWWANGPKVNFPISNQCESADLNGDGKSDLVCSAGNGSTLWAAFYSGGDRWGAFNWLPGGPAAAQPIGLVCSSGDYRGDGQTALMCETYNGTAWSWNVTAMAGGPPDLLTNSQNTFGGHVTVTYVPSSTWSSLYMPVGSISQTVSKVVTDDGLGHSSSETYLYSGALYSSAERTSLGYQAAWNIDSALGSDTLTYFSQTPASAGSPTVVYNYDSLLNLLHYAVTTYVETNAMTYTDKPSVPYSSLVSRKQDVQYTAVGSFSHSIAYAYDGYGNNTVGTDFGDDAVSGDETTVTTSYVPNTASYIVALPSVSDTSGSSAGRVSYIAYEYDTGGSANVAPTKGDVTRIWQWNNLTGAFRSVQKQYDGFGNVVASSDALGRTGTIAYDTTYHTYPLGTSNALGHTTAKAWDYVVGAALTSTDANGGQTTFEYDAFGRKRLERDATGAMSTWLYGDRSASSSAYVYQTLPDGTADGGLISATWIDGLGREYATAKESASGVYSWQYTNYRGDSSEMSQQSLWLAAGASPIWITYSYDTLARPIGVTNPGGSSSSIAYLLDPANKPYTISTDPLGHRKLQWTDTNGNITRIREVNNNGASNYDTNFVYDTLSHPVQTTDAAGNVSKATFDSWDNKLSMVDPDLGSQNFTYDFAGQLLTQTDAKGQVTSYAYDLLGRMKAKTAGGQTSNWYYDEPGHGYAVGKLTGVVYPGGGKSQSFSKLGQITSSTTCIGTVNAVCKTVGSTYDAIGRPATVTYHDGEVVINGYDASGALASVSGYVTAMKWSPAGQLLSMSYANGTTNTYTYDPNHQWLDTAEAVNGAGKLYTAGYTYDSAGRVKSMTQGTPSPLVSYYGYDDLNRLTDVTGAQAQSYAYDAIGNITSNSEIGAYTYDPAHKHAVKSAGSNSYAYDANGNMLSGAGRTLTWDALNRATSVSSGSAVATYVYDDDEERIQKTVGGVSTLYFSDLLEQNGSTPIQYYYAGPILVAEKRAGAKNWYHADRLGSTRVMTDASGNKVRDYDYQAFGATASSTGSAINERGYTGHIADAESGLIYMGARYYDATLSRVISADSIIPDEDDPQSLNRYSYVNNNPISNTDPTGHFSCGVCDWVINAGGHAVNFAGHVLGVDTVIKFIKHPTVIGGLEALGAIATTLVPEGKLVSAVGSAVAKGLGKSAADATATAARNKIFNSVRKLLKLSKNGPVNGLSRTRGATSYYLTKLADKYIKEANKDFKLARASGNAILFGAAAREYSLAMQATELSLTTLPGPDGWAHGNARIQRLKRVCHRAMTGYDHHHYGRKSQHKSAGCK